MTDETEPQAPHRPGDVFHPAVDVTDLIASSDGAETAGLATDGEVGVDEAVVPPGTSAPEADTATIDPWAESPFGSLTGTVTRHGRLPGRAAPMPSPPKPSTEEEDRRAAEALREKTSMERKEALTQAGLTVHLDRDMIRSIEPEFEVQGWLRPDEASRKKEERRAELKAILETIAQLPEVLEFNPGVTLICSFDNARGKTTLAKALRYAAKYQDILEREGAETAERWVFNPRDDDLTELYGAGLAPSIARGMSVSSLSHASRTMHYYDSTVVAGELSQMHRDMGRGHTVYSSDGYNISSGPQHFQDGLSHRQTIDERLFEHLRSERAAAEEAKTGQKRWGNPAGPQLVFIDEPENGASIRRQYRLADELVETGPDGSAFIVPTNSVKLFESDLPRINLDMPELGIHRPSQHLERYIEAYPELDHFRDLAQAAA